MPDQPSLDVLRAFGVAEAPRRLPGGQGTSWAAGGLVLKPGGDPVQEWLAQALSEVTADGFRLPAPVRTRDGAWSYDGWAASHWVEGHEPDHARPSTTLDVIAAGRSFHRAVAHVERPDCLGARDDRWAVADRVAWGEEEVRLRPELAELRRRLRGALGPMGPSQVVHADLTGNVLLSPTLPPAVIDVAPYWRPPAYAEGVVVADALCWHDARPSLLEQAGVSVTAVARALLFRLTTTNLAALAGVGGVDVDGEARRCAHAVAAIGL